MKFSLLVYPVYRNLSCVLHTRRPLYSQHHTMNPLWPTPWDPSVYLYRGVSPIQGYMILYTALCSGDSRQCPIQRGVLYSGVLCREVPLSLSTYTGSIHHQYRIAPKYVVHRLLKMSFAFEIQSHSSCHSGVRCRAADRPCWFWSHHHHPSPPWSRQTKLMEYSSHGAPLVFSWSTHNQVSPSTVKGTHLRRKVGSRGRITLSSYVALNC